MTKPMAKIDLNDDRGIQTELPLDSDKDLLSLSFSDSDARNAKHQALQRYLNNEKETIACVNSYSPGKRKTSYFRLSYRQGRRMKHIHIRGGSTISDLAKYRAKKLQVLIDRGAELEEIIAQAKTFNSGK